MRETVEIEGNEFWLSKIFTLLKVKTTKTAWDETKWNCRLPLFPIFIDTLHYTVTNCFVTIIQVLVQTFNTTLGACGGIEMEQPSEKLVCALIGDKTCSVCNQQNKSNKGRRNSFQKVASAISGNTPSSWWPGEHINGTTLPVSQLEQGGALPPLKF